MPSLPSARNDNAPPSLAAQSALWHTRAYAELLRPRLTALTRETSDPARALARHLMECIGCRRAIRCEVCPVARATAYT